MNAPLTPIRALIVEDSEDDMLLLLAELQRGGYHVDHTRVESEEEMVAALEGPSWDIVIADYSMPRFSGLRALEIMTNRGCDLPFIIVSGNIGEDTAVEAMKAGARDYLIKGKLARLVPAVQRELSEAVVRREHRLGEVALRNSEELFRQLAGNIPELLWITDAALKRLIYISPAFERIWGRKAESLYLDPASWLDAVHPGDQARVRAERRKAPFGDYNEEFRIMWADGTTRWVHERAFPVRDASGAVYRIAGITEDITARKKSEEHLMYMAHYDLLSRLPNRTLFQDRLAQGIAQSKREGWITAVVFIDLDRFKVINDTLGHGAGDKLIVAVAQRVSDTVRSGDTVGRLGGDEFALILQNLGRGQDAGVVAHKVIQVLAEPFDVEGHEIFVTASIGITLYPIDSEIPEALLKNADSAMYRAKQLGRNNFQFYTMEMNARSGENLHLENSLRHALNREEFLLHYQPKADVRTGRIIGVEALMRWQHPEFGMVSPGKFIPLLEETGLIVPAGEWVVRAACEQLRVWQREGLQAVPISVNVSGRQFQHKDLVQSITGIITDAGIDPGLIELELTESSLMTNPHEANILLHSLKEFGLQISVDDFGTGYSSLAYLKRFRIDTLKIDRSFVQDVTHDNDDAAIVRAVITLAHSLKLNVVAEGVETEEQLEFLINNGCDQIQGYLLSVPLPASACTQFLTGGKRLPQILGQAPTLRLVAG
jgi:diguanylate cyclase (GGDEF)-like protein/PAS domain S-box-containing protein